MQWILWHSWFILYFIFVLCSKLLFATQVFRININSLQHMHKLVRRSLVGLGRFSLTADPRKQRDCEDQAECTEDPHHCGDFIWKIKRPITHIKGAELETGAYVKSILELAVAVGGTDWITFQLFWVWVMYTFPITFGGKKSHPLCDTQGKKLQDNRNFFMSVVFINEMKKWNWAWVRGEGRPNDPDLPLFLQMSQCSMMGQY